MPDAASTEKKRLNFDIPASLHRSLKIMAAEEGMSLKDLVLSALEARAHNRRTVHHDEPKVTARKSPSRAE